MAAYLGLSQEAFRTEYVTRQKGDWFTLRSKKKKADGTEPCGLLDEDGRCTVYEARPTQCRTYPFWDELIESRESWEKESVLSEIIARQGANGGYEATASQTRKWDPIDGGCEGINLPGAPLIPPGQISSNALEERLWEKDLKTAFEDDFNGGGGTARGLEL